MFRLYFLTAWRSLRKNRFFTLINITGLSVASAAFFLLFNYVRFERSYEQPHPHAENIYRVSIDLYEGSKYVVTDCETYPPMGPYFKMKYPEVLDYVRVQDMGDRELTAGTRAFRTDRIFAADPSLLTSFGYTILKGNAGAALSEPGKLVVNETIANKLFGDTDPVGQRVMFLGDPFEVSAVMQDAPANTHLRPEALFSMKDLAKRGMNLESWSGNNNYLYLLMRPGTVLQDFNLKLESFSRERLKQEIAKAEPMTDIHLYSNKTFEPDVNGNARSVSILLGIALLVIFIGSANYVNLATARLAEKQKESGLRKILGSSRITLLTSFIIESAIINAFALALAILLAKLALPVYAGFVGDAPAATLFEPGSVLLVFGSLFVVNVLLSGLYPAIVLSSVKASVVTRRNFSGSGGNAVFRKALVVGQFAIALVVLSASVIIYQQMRFVRNRDLGMSLEQVLVLRGPSLTTPDSLRFTAGAHFRQQLLNIKNVENVSVAASLPGRGLSTMNTRTGIRRMEDTHRNGYNFYFYGVDDNFLDVMSIRLAAGKNFSPNPVENTKTVLINEEAVRLLGFASADAAVGRKISLATDDPNEFYEVRGVMRNYIQQSLKEAQIPMIHTYQQDITDLVALKVRPESMQSTIAAVTAAWEKDFGGHMLDYFFLDEMYNQQYAGDQRFGSILNVFSGFTLFITILGLLGLATYNAANRKREIGIRKVLGASTSGIIALLSRDFIRMVVLAAIIAVPLAWYISNSWLEGFSHRIGISWWVFAGTGLLVSTLTLMTIVLQGLKTASANPVSSLKSE